MKLLVLIFCSILPSQAYAHFVCSGPKDKAEFSSGDPSHFKVYLQSDGRISVSKVRASEEPWTLLGEWKEKDEGRLDFLLTDTDDVVWRGSGTRSAIKDLPVFDRLKLDFNSETGKAFALNCKATELY